MITAMEHYNVPPPLPCQTPESIQRALPYYFRRWRPTTNSLTLAPPAEVRQEALQPLSPPSLPKALPDGQARDRVHSP